eukprot:scaffold18879_cov17-Tisochrysis_lutea.AAC.1
MSLVSQETFASIHVHYVFGLGEWSRTTPDDVTWRNRPLAPCRPESEQAACGVAAFDATVRGGTTQDCPCFSLRLASRPDASVSESYFSSAATLHSCCSHFCSTDYCSPLYVLSQHAR